MTDFINVSQNAGFLHNCYKKAQRKQLWNWNLKNFRPEWCSALPTELSSQLGAGHIISS